MVSSLSFYSTRREYRFTKVRQNIPFHSMGIFPLIFGEVRMMGAHLLYTLRILWCISSTIHFTLITTNKLQIHYVHVQRCTSLFGSHRSSFRLWTKIFTTACRPSRAPRTAEPHACSSRASRFAEPHARPSCSSRTAEAAFPSDPCITNHRVACPSELCVTNY